MKIISIVGARPQFIKLAPLDKRIRKKHQHLIIHTGQHYDYEMSKGLFEQLEIPEPDYNLEIGSGSHAWQTGQMLYKLGETLENLKIDLVLVYGDTNSTLAGALAAIKLHIPVGHVEAGYRSGDISMPEEVNRIIVDRIAQILFAPSSHEVENLLHEGISSERIILTGNIMAESLFKNISKLKESSIIQDLVLEPRRYALLTVHRPENTNSKERLTNIVKGLAQSSFPIIFPAHPRTIKYLEEYGLLDILSSGRIKLLPPLKYLDFLKLESDARFIITDSGGIQEEAMIFKVPCLTLRYNTERSITLRVGANRLVGTDTEKISQGIQSILEWPDTDWEIPSLWDTNVSDRIIKSIEINKSLFCIQPQKLEL